VTPETLKAAGLIGSIRKDVKILGSGELSKKLSISAHSFSKSAREKIEGAGGSISWLRGEPVPKRQKPPKRGPGSVKGTVTDADETAVSEAVEAGLDEGVAAAETEES
jgi:hypothetical protein